MRIGLDIRPFLKEETGIGIYFKNFLFHLAQIDNSNEYFLFSSSFKDRFPSQKIPPFSKMSFRDLSFPVKVLNLLWLRFNWPPLDSFFRIDLDLTHSPTPIILPTRGKKVVTVHDLFFMEFPQLTDKETRRSLFRKSEQSLRRADGIVVVSHFTKHQIIGRFGLEEEKIKVIYHGMDPKFLADISSEAAKKTKRKYSLPSSFILFVGAMEPRKNLLNLIEALKVLHERFERIPLVLVGQRGQDSENVRDTIRQNKLENWVKMLGYLPEEELIHLYHLASVFVFPSFCEGFGLPLLEAMSSGLPIAASSATAIPEIAGDAALYFDPHNFNDIADKIGQAIGDENLRQSIIVKGKERVKDFDWKKTAVETLEFYNEIVGQEK